MQPLWCIMPAAKKTTASKSKSKVTSVVDTPITVETVTVAAPTKTKVSKAKAPKATKPKATKSAIATETDPRCGGEDRQRCCPV